MDTDLTCKTAYPILLVHSDGVSDICAVYTAIAAALRAKGL